MWSMPRSILKVVAVIIAACAVTGLVLGFQGAPRKGRLPGESVKGESAEALTATDVQPLIEDIAPPPPPPEDKKAEEEKPEEADPALATTPETPAAPTPTPAKPAPKPAGPEDKVGDLLDGVTPPPQEEPPH
ncbi:MAG: hypothetical protein CFE28_01295 [Alphaproteobacteria bacterium PA2]|nr:MAG: hypothetical protein CFE28_01295 [Alphaproteobacteria bacterium PA2]